MEVDGYSPEPQPPRETRRAGAIWPWAAALVVVVVAVVAYLLLFRSRAAEPQPAEAPAPAPAVATAAPEERPPVELPPLADSDQWLRRAVAELSTHPELTRWLVTDELARRFVAAVDNVADGLSPRPHLGFLDPTDGFEAVRQSGGYVPDPASYRRFGRLAAVVDSIDAAGAAQLYRDVKPLLDDAYAELGYPGRDFDDTLARAIAHLLATPIPERPVELEPTVEAYAFKDPELEKLTAAQKHLLRLGPDNARLVRQKLQQIAQLLGLAGA